MKRFGLKKMLCIASLLALFTPAAVYADMGDFGFFGGISEGRDLPKTTEQLVKKDNKKEDLDAVYKEVIFLTGQPVTFEGIMTVSDSSKPKDEDMTGEYDVEYSIRGSDATDTETADLTRNLKYKVSYRKEGSQTIKDYAVDDWNETINLGETAYTLDEDQSKSTISVIEDNTPGVTYYKGNLSHKAIYTYEEEKVVLEISGTFYGYNCAYSSTETHRLDCTVTTPDWQMQYQLRPSVSLGKTLQYTKNEPTAISFEGNYQEVMQNKCGMSYDIFVLPTQFTYTTPTTGSISIDTFNNFEQLIAPNVAFLKGHFAEEDIRRMFSMEILDGDPKLYQPSQAITRGQFVQMLVKAVKLPIEQAKTSKRSSRKTVVNLVFPDVLPDRPDYQYIMAAYNSGLAVGRDNGHFYIDSPIERQEAIVILTRTLGLENLGLDPTPVTSFTDDASIASWAKKEVYAANRLGIIAGDEDGRFKPNQNVSKAEAAAFVNRLNQYMRTDLQTDYTEHIVNYSN